MRAIILIGLLVGPCTFGVLANETTTANLSSILPPALSNDSDTQQFRQNAIKELERIAHGTEQFSLEFFKLLSRAVSGLNYDFIVSPFSIWSLLVLQAEGADGNTRTQLQQVLRLPEEFTYLRSSYKHINESLNIRASNVQVTSSQVLFSDKNRPIDPEYAYKLDHFYAADHMPVNFYNVVEAYNVINQYVNERTNGQIPKIVNMDDLREAQMLSISTLFFRGQWKSPFNVSYTSEEPFYDEYDNFKGNVFMMFQRGQFSYTGIKDLDSHVLEMPYGDDDRLSMLIMLPRKKVQLTTVLDRLASYGISRVLTELRRADADYDVDLMEVFLPRFSISADFTLNVILEQMGLTDIFDAKKANLSKITSHPIYLSRMIHKTRIEVNEVGTVASAATGAIFANKAISPRFYANRPFAFMIIEKKTNTLLFCGQVRNPGKVDFKQL